LFILPAKKTLASSKFLLALAISVGIGACGGGGAKAPDSGTPTPDPTIVAGAVSASLALTVDTVQLNSDAKTPVTFTARVKDKNQNGIKDQAVTFSTTDTGVTLTPLSDKTDAAGKVSATLIPDTDPSNRAVTVTATSGTVSSSLQVTVAGTTLSVSGPNAVVSGSQIALSYILKDSAGTKLGGRQVNVRSGANTLSAVSGTTCVGSGATFSCTTDSNGQINVNFLGTAAGSDTVTATALGAAVTQAVVVSGDNFLFTSPTPGTTPELALNSAVSASNPATAVTVQFRQNGAAVSGATIVFSTNRGVVGNTLAVAGNSSSIEIISDLSGMATAYISSPSQVGTATITAAVKGGTASTQTNVEFVSISPTSIILQSNPATLSVTRAGAPASQTEIIALVRDVQNNPVKNVDVTFATTKDQSGGTVGTTARTNSFGQASVFYTAGPNPSGQDGVEITGTMNIPISVSAKTNLTVTGTVFIITGLDNLISVSASSSVIYVKELVDVVTNSASNPVANQVVSVQMQPKFYFKGEYRKAIPSGSTTEIWTRGGFNGHPGTWAAGDVYVCANEDANNNGSLDAGDFDENGNKTIEPRFPGTLSASGGTGANTVTTTDSIGVGSFKLNYPKNYATWVNVDIISKTTVGGSESSASVNLTLPVLATELTTLTADPSNVVSPFGIGPCSLPN
jgi:Bacterial Ig-like domain (group 1)